MALLEVKNIYKSFGGVKAIQNFSIEANAGEIHGIIGPNGAGKTYHLQHDFGRVHRRPRLRYAGRQGHTPSWSSTKSPALAWDAPSRISACSRG